MNGKAEQDDFELFKAIDVLIDEEQRLFRDSDPRTRPASQTRLAEIRLELDRLWDLVRQRRAHVEFGLDPNASSPRDASTVEDYEQ